MTAFQVTAGLVASMTLSIISLQFIQTRRNERLDAYDTLIEGTGILHAIWLYRNNPRLATQLEQVQYPTDVNLQKAGMVRVKLVDGWFPTSAKLSDTPDEPQVHGN
jgi:hypothetical protein